MVETKKYYWLKLKDGFFTEKEIKKLRKIAGGDTYTIIYLKLQLLSIKNGGKIIFEGIEENFEDEMALTLDEDVDNIKFTILFLQRYGLIEEINDSEYLLPRVVECIGSESTSAERVRKHRENKKMLQSNTLALQCNTDVTPSSDVVTKCNTEKEKREKRKEIKEDKIIYSDAVKLTANEYEKLIQQFGQAGANDRIENLSLYIQSKGDKYKSHYATILSWERKNPQPKNSKGKWDDIAL